MTHICNACSHSVLEHLHVRVTSTDDDDDDDDDDGDDDDDFSILTNAAAFQPLYAFNNLRKLDILTNYDVQLDDITLFQMAKAWPLLEEFAIIGGHHQSTRITANALAVLLQHCPHLNMVSVEVDWSAVDKPDVSPDIPYQGPPHNNLSYANFAFSRIRHTAGVAAFLSTIAPKLEYVFAWDHTRWTEVNRLVKTFSSIRDRDGRMMADAGRVAGSDVRVSAEDDPEDDPGMERGRWMIRDMHIMDHLSASYQPYYEWLHYGGRKTGALLSI